MWGGVAVMSDDLSYGGNDGYDPELEPKRFLERHPRLRTSLYVLLFAYIIGGAICGTIGLYRASMYTESARAD